MDLVVYGNHLLLHFKVAYAFAGTANFYCTGKFSPNKHSSEEIFCSEWLQKFVIQLSVCKSSYPLHITKHNLSRLV